MQESCRRYITSRMLCFVRRTLDRVLSEYLCESGVVWVLGFVLFLYPITRESDPAPRKTAASVAPSGAGSHSNFNLVALRCPDSRDSSGQRTTPPKMAPSTTPTHEENYSEKTGPIWDHNELTMATWIDERVRWAVNKEPNYGSLATEGYIMDRARLYTLPRSMVWLSEKAG